FTPLNRNAFLAATDAVNCSLTAATELMTGRKIAYALVRPPGHHAERSSFGGFCYLNSLAVASEMLSSKGKVAILDIDYHHGNGQQDIFYRRDDVLTISIHGHPNIAYPYFSGFEDEKGEGPGRGFNINYPLKEELGGEDYRLTLQKATDRIRTFRPSFLVIALGLDTSRKDPTGSWSLTAKDFFLNGELLGSLQIPTLIVQEGGYNTRFIGINARNFFLGFWKSFYEWKGRVPSNKFR
ncbi:MAG TPA: histone deacetylase family protein, partial [Synergistales bacterium]|nr:histone deacetylase family protein [Synergistales bacterium]